MPASGPAPSSLAEEIRSRLRELADPSRAAGQQAYMKSAMPFLGVRVPDATRAARLAAKGHTPEDLLVTAGELWDGATRREERYAAMALLKPASTDGDLAVIAIIERFVREGQWWDITDDLAHRVEELLGAYPDEVAALMRAWSTDADMWIRRVSIICQLQRRAHTDTALLTDTIEANLADRDFFIRKAIGWALRQYARTDPVWVQEFVRSHELSPLSRREALKHIGAQS